MLFGSVNLSGFLPEVIKNQLNHLRVFNACNHFDLATAVFTDLDVDVENTLESLHPGHSAVALCGALVTPASIETFRLIGLFAPLSGCYLNAVFAVRCKKPVESSKVDPRLGYQSR